MISMPSKRQAVRRPQNKLNSATTHVSTEFSHYWASFILFGLTIISCIVCLIFYAVPYRLKIQLNQTDSNPIVVSSVRAYGSTEIQTVENDAALVEATELSILGNFVVGSVTTGRSVLLGGQDVSDVLTCLQGKQFGVLVAENVNFSCSAILFDNSTNTSSAIGVLKIENVDASDKIVQAEKFDAQLLASSTKLFLGLGHALQSGWYACVAHLNFCTDPSNVTSTVLSGLPVCRFGVYDTHADASESQILQTTQSSHYLSSLQTSQPSNDQQNNFFMVFQDKLFIDTNTPLSGLGLQFLVAVADNVAFMQFRYSISVYISQTV